MYYLVSKTFYRSVFYIIGLITTNRKDNMTNNKWKDIYINIINKASKRLGYSAADLNPWFYIVHDHLYRSNANNLKEFKQQLKQGRK
jgi:hypothetical protein